MPRAPAFPGFTQRCLLCPSEARDPQGATGATTAQILACSVSPTPGQEGSRGQDRDLTRVCLTPK